VTNRFPMADREFGCAKACTSRIFPFSPGAEGGPVCNHMSPNFDS